MAGKRTRNGSEEDAATAAAPPKSFMEESADALAGVEGALTGSKRKATSPGDEGASPAKKKNPKPAEARARPRSNSIEMLSEVAGSLLKDSSSEALAATLGSSVPNPIAAAAAAEVIKAATFVLPTSIPTGFRKKGTSTSIGASSSKLGVASPPPPAAAASKPHPPPPLTAAAIAAANDTAAVQAFAAAASLNNAKSNKKTQITYNPDIPMTKEQLTAWRREMRRVRNRESAAASRRKVRDRIEELEEEVDVWKRRYQEVMARLGQAESGGGKKRKTGGNSGKSEEGHEVDV